MVTQALRQISKRHHERVELFGRFPERNAALGRAGTVAEEVYMKSQHAKQFGV